MMRLGQGCSPASLPSLTRTLRSHRLRERYAYFHSELDEHSLIVQKIRLQKLLSIVSHHLRQLDAATRWRLAAPSGRMVSDVLYYRCGRSDDFQRAGASTFVDGLKQVTQPSKI